MASVKISIGQVTVELRESYDLSWLQTYGTVFAVFDRQDSGNLSFGVASKERKRFVKIAGVRTLEYAGDPQDVVERLKLAVPVYQDLAHKHLIRLEEHFEIPRGYALVFEWFEGECLHPHWAFPPPAKYTDPASPYARFRKLPIERRLEAMEAILDFHTAVEERGYVAIDFYDGSILYDFQAGKIKICDIDLYRRRPFRNLMGRMWGSTRFMSPEEFELGAAIDQRTNVFNMGAMAFALLGGETDRSYARWEAGALLYDRARRAVEAERAERYGSVAEFHREWKMAVRLR